MIADFPLFKAILKLIGAIIFALLMPLVPILKPVLYLLALLAKFLIKTFMAKTPMAELGAWLGFLAGGILAIMAGLPALAVAGITAAVALLGVGAAKFGEWLRKIYPPEKLWADIKKAGAWLGGLFEDMGRWIWNAIMAGWDALKSVGLWIWEQVLLPAFSFLKNAGVWIWNQIIQPAFNLLSNVGSWIWNQILLPAFNFLTSVGSWIWEQILKPALNFLAPVGSWIWEQILKPAWNFLSGIGTWIWDILKVPFQAVADAIQSAVKAIKNLGGTIWNSIKSAASSVASAVGITSPAKNAPVFPGLKDGIVQNGKVITTDPKDYIIATKTPGSLGKGGGNTTININIDKPSLRSESDIKTLVREISMRLQSDMRGRVSYT
jgi:hypothetical protein